MSELCISKCHFSSLVISDFILLCSFILSHPLYFSYFIFFSPYLLKLISFLSPLFLTTFLLSLAFLAGFESSQTLFTSILQRLQFKKDHCPNEEDDLGIYEIVFGPPSMAAVTEEQDPSQILDQTQQKDHILEPNPLPGSEMEDPNPIVAKGEEFEESKVSLSSKSEVPCAVVMEEKRLENFLKILDEFERLTSNAEEKKKKKTKKQEPPRGAKSNNVVEKQKSLFMNVGSEAADRNNNNENQTNDPTKLESSTMAKSQSQRVITAADDGDREDLSSYGSMRREREWKRTLACKLFEERHNAAAAGGGGGGEAMDSLWEAYEVDSEKLNKRRSEKAKKKVEREWEEDDEVGGAQLCCLQALKLSAGKMNLGVGKPNLVKISKAIKGIGWLHNLTKNSKKVHNNGDHRY